MFKPMGPFRDSWAPSWLSGPRTDVPTEPPTHKALLLLPVQHLIYFDYIYSCMYVDFILSSNKHYSFYLEIIYKLC